MTDKPEEFLAKYKTKLDSSGKPQEETIFMHCVVALLMDISQSNNEILDRLREMDHE